MGFVLIANVRQAMIAAEFGIPKNVILKHPQQELLVMQRNSDKRRRDPRSIDMAAIIALLALVIAASAV